MCSSAGQRPALPDISVLSASANGQRVLRWICGQRSQGWRSPESSQDDSLREEQIQRGTAGARIAVLLFCGPAARAPRNVRSQCQRSQRYALSTPAQMVNQCCAGSVASADRMYDPPAQKRTALTKP